MQSVPIPLLSSLININNNNSTNFLFNSHSSKAPTSGINNNNFASRNNLHHPHHNHQNQNMPKSSYNETAISTELECFITKSSSSDSLRINEDDIDIELSSEDSNDEFDIKPTIATNINDIELISIDNLKNETTESHLAKKKYHKKLKHHHHHHRSKHCNFQPQWLLYISSLDRLFSNKIHKLSCGTIDYLFVFGAFVFGSKFMPITILLSIFLVDIPGFIYLLLSCTITVTLTQFGKKVFGRHRPDPKTLAPKRLDFRTRLTNYSFPSGDTAQAAAYSMSLFCLTNNLWLLLLIPNCAWSRVYFGCHWICDCIIGAFVGCAIPLFIYSMIPQESFVHTQQTIINWMH